MKIRTGFVSNSSSASFIITAQCNEDTFLTAFEDSYGWENDIKEFKKDLQLCINEITDTKCKYFKNKEDLKSEIGIAFVEATNKRIKKLKRISKMADKYIFEAYLERFDVSCEFKEQETVLKFITSMHNEYISSLPIFLTNLILKLMGDYQIVVNIKTTSE